MARKIRYGVVRNGEHLSLHSNKTDADTAAADECEFIQQAARDGWTTQRGADETRVWVEEVRGYAW